MQERKVVLMPAESAKVGYTFKRWVGESDCLDCPLRDFCGGDLDPKANYRVKSVRDAGRKCPKTGEELRAVEIERVPIVTIVEKKGLIKGMTVAFKKVPCDSVLNEYFFYCQKQLDDGDRIRVEEVLRDVTINGHEYAMVRGSLKSEASGNKEKKARSLPHVLALKLLYL
ncbi:UPF0179 family protein [Tardisphaera miroshnichenkoae]